MLSRAISESGKWGVKKLRGGRKTDLEQISVYQKMNTSPQWSIR